MVEIRNRDDLEKWLEDKPREWATIIAVRSALRVVPALGRSIQGIKLETDWQSAIVLPVFRACIITTISPLFFDRKLSLDNVADAALAASMAAQNVIDIASAADAVVSACTYAVNIVQTSAKDAAYLSASSSHAASYAASYVAPMGYTSASNVIWDGTTADYSGLQIQRNVASEGLWYLGMPLFLSQFWFDLKVALLKEGDHWQTLIQWYEDRLMGDDAAVKAGRPRIKEMEVEIANLPEEIWRDAKRANEAIAEIQSRYWDDQADPEAPEEEDPDLIIPPQRPAAIEPVWVDGVLTLPDEPAASNLPHPPLEASLAALKKRMNALVADARQVSNIDQRFVSHIESIGQLIPTEAPDQISLFELGHELETLQQAQKTITEEWPDLLAARYASTILAYDKTVRQFPDWKLFVRNADDIHYSEEEIEAAPEFVSEVAAALREGELSVIVDAAIPDALDRLVSPDETSEWSNVLDHVPEGQWIDGIESSSNIFKELLVPILDGFESNKGEYGIRYKIGESFGKEASKQAYNIAPNLIKAVKKILASKTCKAGGATLFAQQLGWLEPFKPLLEKLITMLT